MSIICYKCVNNSMKVSCKVKLNSFIKKFVEKSFSATVFWTTFEFLKIFLLNFSERSAQLEASFKARPPALRRVERRGDLRLRHHHQGIGQEVREGYGRGSDQWAEERSARNGHHGPKSSPMVTFITPNYLLHKPATSWSSYG